MPVLTFAGKDFIADDLDAEGLHKDYLNSRVRLNLNVPAAAFLSS